MSCTLLHSIGSINLTRPNRQMLDLLQPSEVLTSKIASQPINRRLKPCAVMLVDLLHVLTVSFFAMGLPQAACLGFDKQ